MRIHICSFVTLLATGVNCFSIISSGASCGYNKNSFLAASTKLTDWVIENLDPDSSSASETKAGENDTLPPGGLVIADRFHILPINSKVEVEGDLVPIRLLLSGKSGGWGTGVHPTTVLCLNWLAEKLLGGENMLDYGCGSGILSIAALGLGAATSVGVDVEAEALVTAEKNMELNGFDDRYEGLHVREVVPFCLRRPGADVCVANILIGQLVRPSMVSAIVTNLAPGGFLCLSGIRPHEVESLKAAYDDHIEWLDDDYCELSATETEGSIESYGFDVGTWSRVVGRMKSGGIDILSMSELAVS